MTEKLVEQKLIKHILFSLPSFINNRINNATNCEYFQTFRGKRVNYRVMFRFFFLSCYCKRTSGLWKRREVFGIVRQTRAIAVHFQPEMYNESSKPVPEGCCVNGNARGRLCFTGSLFKDAPERRANTMLPLLKMNWERKKGGYAKL